MSLAASVYMAGWGSVPSGSAARVAGADAECEFCAPVSTGAPAEASVALLDAVSTAPAAQKSSVDMKNTKCIVMADDIGTSTHTVEYKGKTYHTCCPECIATFNKDPEKYVKAFDLDPAKFGVKK
jgi:YHS domain-containing protein